MNIAIFLVPFVRFVLNRLVTLVGDVGDERELPGP
jgi:hypothetical protein